MVRIDRNLEQIVKAHQSKPQHGQSQLSDESKFKVVSDMLSVVSSPCYILALASCGALLPPLWRLYNHQCLS